MARVNTFDPETEAWLSDLADEMGLPEEPDPTPLHKRLGRKATVRDLLGTGLSYKQIAAQTGIPFSAVAGLARNLRRAKEEPTTPERDQRIAEALRSGTKRRDVWKTFGIGNTEIKRIREEYNVE